MNFNEKNLKYIVSFSGGKDSTAMLLRMLEENMPVEEIVFCDTGKDFMKCLNYYRNENKNKYFVDVKEDFKFGLIHQDWIFEPVVLRIACDDYDDLFEFVQGDK